MATVAGMSLSLNKKLTVVFENTTEDPTLDVEVSIDGGSNYYDVEFRDTEYDLKVSNVSNKLVDLYWNGLVFVASFLDAEIEQQDISYDGNSGAFNSGHEDVAVTIGEDTPTPANPVGYNYSQIVDGDLPTDIAEWLIGGGVLTSNLDIANATGDGSGSSVFIYQSPSFISGNKFILNAKARVTNSDCIQIRVGTNLLTVDSITPPNENEWYNLKGIIEITTDTQIRVRADYPDDTTANGKVMEIDYAMAIPVPTLMESWTDEQILRNFENFKYIETGLHALGESKTLDQLLDNRNEFGNWALGDNTEISLNNQDNIPYLKLIGDGQFRNNDSVISLESSKQYTILYHILNYTGNNAAFDIGFRGLKNSTDILYPGNINNGLFKLAVSTEDTIVSDFGVISNTTLTAGS
jgi:hypothetical protein